MIDVVVYVEFADDSHAPEWTDGEEFAANARLAALPGIGMVVTGLADYDGRLYSVRVRDVQLSNHNPTPFVFGVAE